MRMASQRDALVTPACTLRLIRRCVRALCAAIDKINAHAAAADGIWCGGSGESIDARGGGGWRAGVRHPAERLRAASRTRRPSPHHAPVSAADSQQLAFCGTRQEKAAPARQLAIK